MSTEKPHAQPTQIQPTRSPDRSVRSATPAAGPDATTPAAGPDATAPAAEPDATTPAAKPDATAPSTMVAGAVPAPKQSRRQRKKLPTERPPGAPPDPWTAFASTSDRPPGRIRRVRQVVGRALIHEYALVTWAALLLAVAMTWPTLQYPLHTIPQDTWDPSLQAWQVAWSGHALLSDPTQLWQANAFYPERFGLAFSDSLLGYAPAGMLGSGPTAAVLRYNILFVLAHALLVIGAYALVRQLGARRTGAAVAAVAFAYPPWRLAQEGHLDIVSAGGIPLALAMLARGHGWSMRYGFRRNHRHAGWAAAGWLVATWQLGLGFSLGLPLAYVLGAVVVVLLVAVPLRRLLRRSEGAVLGWRLITADVLGALIFAGVGALLAVPYRKVADLHPNAVATTAEIDFFSPPVQSLFIGPAESRIWGVAHTAPRAALPWYPEMTLLPGFVLYALAIGGLLFSIWTVRQRLLLLAGVLATAVLSLGTTFFEGRWTYLPLFGHLPGLTGARTPGRLVLWTTLLLGVLAAGAVCEFIRRAEQMSALRVPPWPGPWLRLTTLLPLLLVAVEGINATPHPVVPDQPTTLRTIDGPLLVLPTAQLGDQVVMLWSTSKFQQIANGSSGFVPQRQDELRRAVTAFPDQTSVQYLRTAGITTVVLLRDHAAGTPWERAGDIPVESLGILREDLDDTVVFRL